MPGIDPPPANQNDPAAAPASEAETPETNQAAGRIIVVTGMSGAGRTTALKAMEDMGFEAVDNLPVRMLPTLVRQGPAPDRGLAIGVDVRSRGFRVRTFRDTIEKLRSELDHQPELLFFDCEDEVLRRRFTETRRLHPLAADRPLLDGITREREALSPLRGLANLVIDTSQLNVREMAGVLRRRLGGDAGTRLRVFVLSFSYRNGVPRDADLVFDVRFLRNPHYEPDLKPLTGLNQAVGEFVAADEGFAAFFERLTALLELLVPRYHGEGKSYLTLAIGCTGGRHRSVFLAERLAAWLRDAGHPAEVQHRELEELVALDPTV